MSEINAAAGPSFASDLVGNLDRIFDYLMTVAPTREVCPDVSLTFSEVRAIKQIPGDGSISMRQLAASMGVPLSTATHVVDRLVTKGVVVRVRTEHDRRLVLVELSAEARSHRDLLFRERVALAEQILEPLSVEAREQVVRVLGDVAQAVAAHRATLLARAEAGPDTSSQTGIRS